ncbi:uncharacterized protein MELLADRAFT_101893 [Melampsora larici-populina 98AG31]|uniref:Secreted protein n=1 Tax=Melampsora larici-populina (strain 98AG31 / pathotype 3-4-7) TaxID=747676 RepID=F4R594_MELLP|nr:uncharacterized protein MELLADRAFT_101893 [Melampsora larici-populina 98AG31]EGG12301.1 secreted protein [Melampsora larici-populina 98AG31]
MSFIKFCTTLLTLLVIEAFMVTKVHPAASPHMSPLNPALAPRALPPCPQIWPDKPYPTARERLHDLTLDVKAIKGPGWRPSVCDKPLWNCVFVQRGVEPRRGGFNESARFPIENGNHVEVYEYWQSTMQWSAPGGGGAVNSYMAHGVDYVCVTGTMAVKFLGNASMLFGDPKNPNLHVCECHYPLDDDKFIFNRKV